MKLFFHKLFHWEYWPFQIVYIPIYFQWIYYGLKQKSIFFFNACNPTIKNGGFFMESKKEIYDLIPQKYFPKTTLIKQNTSFHIVEIISKSFAFPFIAKPDIGLRGAAVSKISNMCDLKNYWQKAKFDFLLQEMIPYQNEIGVFYVRYPDQKTGKITGIVAKEFLIVVGNGTSTMRELILENPRFALQLKPLQIEYGQVLDQILPHGEKCNLVPFGNHARGAKFLDASNLISEKMTDVMNEICSQINGFYFGRLDIMFQSIEDFENGKNFAIVELNGAGSEPTHIYDPKHSIFFAWRELSRHVKYMYDISVSNHKNGHQYLSNSDGMQQYRMHLAQSKKMNCQ